MKYHHVNTREIFSGGGRGRAYSKHETCKMDFNSLKPKNYIASRNRYELLSKSLNIVKYISLPQQGREKRKISESFLGNTRYFN